MEEIFLEMCQRLKLVSLTKSVHSLALGRETAAEAAADREENPFIFTKKGIDDDDSTAYTSAKCLTFRL